MLRLILLRHAKSSWDREDWPDHERPLNGRGRHDAPRVGKYLRRHDRVPDLIVASTARRARATAKRVARACGYRRRRLLFPELYLANPPTIVDVLRRLPGAPQSVLAVGHNPGWEQLASRLARDEVVLPTAGLVEFTLPLDQWSELSVDSPATLTARWQPREAK